MDAVQYLKEKARMCNTISCGECSFDKAIMHCTQIQREHPSEAVRIVEEWSKAHPLQTNTDKFKEVFGKDPIAIIRDIANDYGEWLYAPYEAPNRED